MIKSLERRADGSALPEADWEDRTGTVGDAMESGSLWQSPKAKALMQTFRRLTSERQIARGRKDVTVSNRVGEGERIPLLADFLKEVADWHPEDVHGKPAQLYEKAQLLHMIMMLASDDAGRLASSRILITYLTSQDLLGSHPVEWLGYFVSVFRDVRRYPPSIATPLLAEMENHRLPIVALTVRLIKLEESASHITVVERH